MPFDASKTHFEENKVYIFKFKYTGNTVNMIWEVLELSHFKDMCWFGFLNSIIIIPKTYSRSICLYKAKQLLSSSLPPFLFNQSDYPAHKKPPLTPSHPSHTFHASTSIKTPAITPHTPWILPNLFQPPTHQFEFVSLTRHWLILCLSFRSIDNQSQSQNGRCASSTHGQDKIFQHFSVLISFHFSTLLVTKNKIVFVTKENRHPRKVFQWECQTLWKTPPSPWCW